MHLVTTVVVVCALSLTCTHAPASSLHDDPTALAALQVKADQAQPGDRCFLYAELVNQMTDLAGQQFNAGESGQALQTLNRVQQYAEKIHIGIAGDSRKLKDAEVLMQRTSFRLEDILSEASYEDRQTLETALKQLNRVQTQLMTQVFKK
jgi:hypothetical protein